MRALVVSRHGEPAQALTVTDLPAPVPGPGHLGVEVRVAPLSLPDVMLCRGTYAQRPALPFVPGMEALGTVRRVGLGVDPGWVGRRVAGVPVMPHGGLAAECLLEADYVAEVPDGIADEVAAAAFISYSSAHLGLHRRAGLRAGEVLLVHAAAGGIGSAAVQLGAAAGATVIATAGSAEKVAACRRLGATHALNYREDDFAARTMELTDGRGADVVFDPVGGDVFHRSRSCVAVDGRIVVAGFAGGVIQDIRATQVLFRNYSVVGLYVGAYRRGARDREMLRRVHQDVFDGLADGRLAPVIDRVVALSDAPRALQDLADRAVTGKVLVRPGDDEGKAAG